MTSDSQVSELPKQRLGRHRAGSGPADMFHVQTRILRSMAAGQPAQRLAELLCDLVRRHAPGRCASLMRLGADGRGHPLATSGAAPTLVAALDGLPPGPWSGSDAAAIHAAAPVLVEDAGCDLRWAEQRALATAHGIRACWCFPVRQDDRTLGTFALIGATPGLPAPAMLRLLHQAATIAASILLLLDRQDAQREQQETRQRQTERMQRRTGFNAMLAQVNQLAATRPDTAALYEGICRIAVAQADLQLAWVGTPDRTGRFQALAKAGATAFLDEIMVSADPALPEGRGLAGPAWREGRTMVGQGFSTEPILAPWADAARRFGLGAGAALPLMLHAKPVALLLVYAAEDGVLDAELVGLLKELAVDVGRALEAIDQQRHLDRLQALHTALLTEGEVVLRARSDTEMLHRTCAHLAAGGLFHAAWVARPDREGVLRTLAGAGLGMAWLAERRVALDDVPPALAVQAWTGGRTVVRNDTLEDADLARFNSIFDRDVWRSVAVVPILRGGILFAILALGSPQPGLFAPDVLALCERIGELLGRGLDELDLKQALEEERRQQFHLARHDALTGLANRRQFEEHLGHALAGARRRGTPLAVCMLDIDDFKPINDRFGHPAGDALLRQIALRLRDALRQSDLIARLGGDEFVLALDDLGSIDALPGLLGRVAEAMEAPFDLDAATDAVRVGLSLGVAVFPEDGDDPDLLLRRADAALYAAKARKAAREHTWLRWGEEIAGVPAAAPGIDDPYGPEARRLLAATAAIWPAVAAGFIEDFYAGLAGQTLAAPILGALSPAELAGLKDRQTAHLTALMAPTTDREALCRSARVVGQIHALVGVDNVLMVQAIGLYQARLTDHLAARSLRPADRRNLVAVATARLQDDNAAQMEAGTKTIAAYFDVLRWRPQPPGTPWVDAAQVPLDALAGLPGIRAVGLLRPDAAGTFQLIASSSAAGLSFLYVNENSGAVPAIDPARPAGQGLLAEAWRSGEIVTAVNYQTDPRTAPWHATMRRFGVRSQVVLPVCDTQDRPAAVLVVLGAFPCQFEAMWMRHVCAGMAQGLARLWQQRRVAAAVVAETTAAAWRRRLFAGGLDLHYQPIVDLRTGKPVQAEALARLVLEDGQVIAPSQFLPVLGAQDLDELFRLALAAALGQIARWEAVGLSVGVSVNLAPSTLAQPACAFRVRDALRQAQVAPERLFLEITEDQPFSAAGDTAAGAIAALVHLGVNLVMDDLGAGHGSLQRLRSLPFHAVKLDQGLLRDVHGAPARALSFVGALVQLGHDLEIAVVAEGLESDDLVEAAAMLGADSGQGFALGRPMPAAAVPGWARDFVWKVDRKVPRTPLGALATMWRGAHFAGDRHGAVAACPVTRFLEGQGLAGGTLDVAHRALHALAAEAGRHAPRYRDAVAQFQRDLARRVTHPA